eukprot:Gb_32621 [translate_table: standard]
MRPAMHCLDASVILAVSTLTTNHSFLICIMHLLLEVDNQNELLEGKGPSEDQEIFWQRKRERIGSRSSCKVLRRIQGIGCNEVQEKKAQLEPKVVKIYNGCKPESKVLKEPTEDGVENNAEAGQDLLQRLVEAGCPGASMLKEDGDKDEPPVISKDIDAIEDDGSVEADGKDTAIVSEIVVEATETVIKTSADSSEQKVALATS